MTDSSKPAPTKLPYQTPVLTGPYSLSDISKLKAEVARLTALANAVEQAQADAIQSAANVLGTVIAMCELESSLHEKYSILKDRILALTPRRVQIEAELRELKARLDEGYSFVPLIREQELEISIAKLERELKAMA